MHLKADALFLTPYNIVLKTKFLCLLFCSVDFVKWSSQGMLRMIPDAMNALFKPTIDQIIQHLSRYQDRVEFLARILFKLGILESFSWEWHDSDSNFCLHEVLRSQARIYLKFWVQHTSDSLTMFILAHTLKWKWRTSSPALSLLGCFSLSLFFRFWPPWDMQTNFSQNTS